MPETIVALHYWAGAGHEFDALRGLLPPTTRLLAPDLPGFGAQPVPAGFTYSVQAYTDWLARYIQQQGIGGFTLIGHSMGGKIALALAARQPPGLRQLVLLAPSPPSAEPMAAADRAAALAAYGKPDEAEKTFRNITHRPLPALLRARILADNLQTSPGAWAAWLRAGSREDLTSLMPQLRAPCHLLVGTHDAAITPTTQQQLTLPLLPAGTPLTLVPQAGHLLPLEAPAAVAEALRGTENGYSSARLRNSRKPRCPYTPKPSAGSS